MALCDSIVQRASAPSVAHVDVGSLLQQRLDHLHITLEREREREREKETPVTCGPGETRKHTSRAYLGRREV